MNKKGQKNEISEKILLLVIAFILAGVLIYFIGKIAIWLGVGSIIISLILFYIASQTNEDKLSYAGIFFLSFGIILLLGGIAIIYFFENNETGKIWLDSGKTIINTTSDLYKTTIGGK
ncbi:MAG: hypothetical protein QW273_03435 [Candidatus Pacearchaeota archaeon]